MTETHYDSAYYSDKTICCVDCGKTFVFRAGEQAFFNSKRPPLSPPKRCPECRAFRKSTIHPPTDFDSTLTKARSLFPTGGPGQGAPNG